MSLTAAAPLAPGEGRVRDDLNRESLPQSQFDPSRKIAWSNAICAAVLGIGLCLRRDAQQFQFRPETVESAPVVIPEFVPEPPPVNEETVVDEKMEVPPDAVAVPVVVAPDPSKVNFAVTVTGPTVRAADYKYAPPPPRVTQRPTQSGPQIFRGGPSTDGGFYQEPPYPRDALLRKEQGELQLYVVVSEDGTPTEVSVRIASGSPTLDRHSLTFVKKYWRWPAGPRREFLVPVQYRIN